MTSTQTMTTKTDHYYFRAMVVLAALAAMMAAMLLTTGRPAHASTTFRVNNVDSGDGVCNAQECTLREAINAANLTPI